MAGPDFEAWWRELSKWYEERVWQKLPVAQFLNAPAYLVAGHRFLNSATAIASGISAPICLSVFLSHGIEAAQELRLNRQYQQIMAGLSDAELEKILKTEYARIVEGVEQIVAPIVKYVVNFPPNTIHILPLFYNLPEQFQKSTLVHEGTHLVQNEKGLLRMYPFCVEGVADVISLVCDLQSLTMDELAEKEAAIETRNIVEGDELEEAVDAFALISSAGMVAALGTIGVDSLLEDQLRQAPLYRIFESTNYEVIERRTAHGFVLEVLERALQKLFT